MQDPERANPRLTIITDDPPDVVSAFTFSSAASVEAAISSPQERRMGESIVAALREMLETVLFAMLVFLLVQTVLER